MKPAMSLGLVLAAVLMALALGGDAGAAPPGKPAPDLSVTRELAEKIGEAAESLGDLLILQRDVGRAQQAQANIQALGQLTAQLEGLCDELEEAGLALTRQARDHLDSGRADAARDALDEQKKVSELEAELRSRLARLKRLRGSFGPSGEVAPPVSGGRKVAKWFGRRPGARAHSQAIRDGLDWLKRHQDKEGHWDCDGFSKHSESPGSVGHGYALFDPGVTGLALLAFLGAGETPESGTYRRTVKAGLNYLRQIQDPEGCYGPRTTNRFTYNHAPATLAMVEAYALTANPLWKQSAQRAIDFIEMCRNPYLAWRYGVRPQDNDTSVTGWMVSALYAAKQAGLDVPEKAFTGARNWMDKVTEPKWGKAGYTARGTGPARPQDIMDKFPPDRSEALTAEGILIRIMLGEDPARSEMIKKGTALCMNVLPKWNRSSGDVDMYYWYYGATALHQVGGNAWRKWRPALETALLRNQRKDGSAKGSWDPIGPWGREGGRVYSTAMCVLALETPTRHGKVGQGR